MTNAEKFQEIFKKFATEVWAFPEKDFLTWLNSEYKEPTTKNDLGVDCISRTSALDSINWAYNLSNAYQKINDLPSVTPQLSVPEVTALAEWTEKLTKASEDAYNKGYADGMKAQEPILDKLRAEIETKYGQCDICEYFEDYDYEENDISEYRPIGDIADILQIIDKYRDRKGVTG
jgi:hypothetical protein